MHIVDFLGDPAGSADIINAWVKTSTEEKIPELIPVEAITADTVLVLTNAIYFNAAWKEPFKVEDTSDGSFQKLDGSSLTGPMMSGSLAPYRVTSPPAHRDIRNVMITNGRNELPAAVAE